METNERELLPLQGDESQHYAQLSQEIMKNIILAENAGIITLNGFSAIKEPIQVNESKGLVLLLLAKAAKNVRLATIGLKLGYYSGASAIIRSALESLLYATLFDSEPKQIEEWFINEFSQKSSAEINGFRDAQIKEAKQSLLDLETGRLAIKDAMHEFIESANQKIHTSMQGLSEEFGIDVDSLLPDDFRREFEKAGFDFNLAMTRYAFLRRYGNNLTKGQSQDEEYDLTEIQICGKYQEDSIADLALFNFYVAHRILDICKSCFDIEDEEFNKCYKLWHKEIKQIH